MKHLPATVLYAISRISERSFIRSLAILAGGSAIAQAFPLMITPIITRLYTPYDMGVLGVYVSFIAIVSGALSLGYPQAIVAARNEREAAGLTLLSTLLILPVASFTTILLWILNSKSILGFGTLPELSLLFMLVSLVLTDIFYSLRYFLIRLEKFKVISAAAITQSTGRIGTQLFSGLVYPSIWGLVIAEIVGRSLGVGRLWKEVHEALKCHWATISFANLRQIARDNRSFALLLTPATILDNLGPALHVPLIAHYFGVASAGQYSVANMVLLVPMVLVGASVADVFHHRIALYSRGNQGQAIGLFLKVGAALLLVGLILVILVLLLAQPLWGMILGTQWALGGEIAAALAPRVAGQLVVSPLSRVVLVFGGQSLKLAYNALTVGLVLFYYPFAHYMGWSLLDTLSGFALLQVLMQLLYFILLMRIVRNGSR